MRNIWNPGMLLEVSSGYWAGCTLQAAVRLQFFTGLGDDWCTAEELAMNLACDQRSTALLLDALSAMGLLVKDKNKYRNTREAEELLIVDSPGYMGHIILHHHHLLDGWAQLDQVVKTGRKVEKRSYGDDIERESFLLGMFNLAMGIAPRIAGDIDLSGHQCLLDLGGGPGTYAIQFCLANPELKAVIFDKPSTHSFAKSTVEKFGLRDRIEFRGGDFITDNISGGPYDVAWLSHILHSNSIKNCQELIGKTVESMVVGGLILVHDFILDDSKDGPEFPALFSLNMLIAHNGGRSYSEEEIRAMLLEAGVGNIERHPFRAPNESSIVYGVKL